MMTKDRKKLLVFGYGLATILSFLGIRIVFENGLTLISLIFLLLALAMFAVTLLDENILRIVYRKWMIGAHFIGNIFSALVLIVLFYLVFAPVGIILRIMKKDLLDRSIEPGKQSYWIKRKGPEPSIDSYLKQY